MIRKKKVAAFARASLVLLLVFSIGVKNTGAGQIVSGSYSVKESSESGTQVHVTLGIRLSNAGEQRVFITQMSLQNPLRPAQVSEERGTVILEPHLGAGVRRQFTIGKDEFEPLRKSTQLPMYLRIQGADGAETTVTIVLMSRPRLNDE